MYLYEVDQFLIILVCQSMLLLQGVQVLQMLECSNSVLLYRVATIWYQDDLRVRFVRGFPVSNNISVSKSVSSTGCPGSDNNRVSVVSCCTGCL